MGTFSWIHWLIVLVIVMLIFGTKKLRNIGSDLGGAVKGFKDSMKDGEEGKAEMVAEPERLESPTTTARTVDVESTKAREEV